MAAHEQIIADNKADLVRKIDCRKTVLWEELVKRGVIDQDDVEFIKVCISVNP